MDLAQSAQIWRIISGLPKIVVHLFLFSQFGMADHDEPQGGAAAAAAAPAPAKEKEKGAAVYFDVVTAGSAAASSSPVGRKRPRPPSTSNDDDEQPAERQGAVSAAYAATARRGRSPAKSAMVSIDNLLRAAQRQGSNTSSDAAASVSTLADGGGDGGGCETECERALSWRDDDLANAVMRLPKVLPQWAIADPRLYAARTKTIADEEEEEENNNDAGGEGAGPSRRNKRAKAAKTRDPRQPKKARSAYNIFVIEFHEKIKADQQKQKQQRAGGSEGGEEKKEDNDDDAMEDQQRRKFTEVGRKMGQQWKDLHEDDRRKYDDLAAKDKGRYATEMEVYTATKQKEEAEMKKKKDAVGATGAAAAAISTKSNDGAKAAAAGGTNEQHPKEKLLKTPTANRLVSGNRSADGGVLGSIGSGGGASSSSPTKRIRTPAKLLTSVPAPDIGEGWTIKTYQRQTGSSAGHTDSYWYSPALGKKFRSLKEIGRFKQALARVQADAGGAALDAAHAERLAWKAFKHATAGDKK